jgi:hypothetical protein
VIELCLYRGQTMTLALVVTGDALVPEIVAEALYAAKRHWGDPGRAAPIVIRKLAKFYDTELVIGSWTTSGAARKLGSDVIVLDFVSGLVSDRTERKSYRFAKWLKGHGVP